MTSFIVLNYLIEDYDILVCDETFFSSDTYKKKSWGIKGKGKLRISKNKNIESYSLMFTISKIFGLMTF
jgi:hypothetical protein